MIKHKIKHNSQQTKLFPVSLIAVTVHRRAYEKGKSNGPQETKSSMLASVVQVSIGTIQFTFTPKHCLKNVNELFLFC